MSPLCTHLGCKVHWEQRGSELGLPLCHGSRFGVNGTVVQGPAIAPLRPKHLDVGS